MRCITPIGRGNQTSIEARLTDPRLVPCNQQNCPTSRIECKSHAPDTAIGGKSKLLHIRKLRSLQCIDIGTTELWPIVSEHAGRCQQRFSDCQRQSGKLLLECILKSDNPRRLYSPRAIDRQGRSNHRNLLAPVHCMLQLDHFVNLVPMTLPVLRSSRTFKRLQVLACIESSPTWISVKQSGEVHFGNSAFPNFIARRIYTKEIA